MKVVPLTLIAMFSFGLFVWTSSGSVVVGVCAAIALVTIVSSISVAPTAGMMDHKGVSIFFSLVLISVLLIFVVASTVGSPASSSLAIVAYLCIIGALVFLQE